MYECSEHYKRYLCTQQNFQRWKGKYQFWAAAGLNFLHGCVFWSPYPIKLSIIPQRPNPKNLYLYPGEEVQTKERKKPCIVVDQFVLRTTFWLTPPSRTPPPSPSPLIFESFDRRVWKGDCTLRVYCTLRFSIRYSDSVGCPKHNSNQSQLRWWNVMSG